MLSFGTPSALALAIATRSEALVSGLASFRAITAKSFACLVKTFPRLASLAAFLCLIECHLLCPAMDEVRSKKSEVRSGKYFLVILLILRLEGIRRPFPRYYKASKPFHSDKPILLYDYSNEVY